jgi:multicomponent Na+:H+ antiporter subunit D
MNHLPALAVVVPLLSAPLCVLLRRELLARALATVVCATCFAIACGLTDQVGAGTISYHVGGWEPPWGIELRADTLTVFVLLVVTFVASVVVITGIGDGSHRVPKGREAFYYAAFLLCLAGLSGMTMTGDAFNVFVFLEISSLSTYTLIALGRSRRALTAALAYLMVGTVGGTFILLGIGMLYQMTGSLNMADLARLIPALVGNRTLILAFGFLMVGLGLKVAIFPLHQWLPNAYAFAPSSVSAFVAGTATKVIYYLFIRFALTVFGAAVVYETFHVQDLLIPLSLLAMFVGSTAAIYQKDFKRLLAYSSVAQLGYLTLALSFGTELGLKAGLIHVANHAVMKSGLFLVAAAVVARVGSARIDDMAGLGKHMPLTMAALVVGGLGLIGVPGTAGFISKWYLVLAALERGNLVVAALILISSLLAVAYVWRLVEVVYFRQPKRLPPEKQESPGLLIPAWALMGATVYFGFFSDGSSAMAARAAQQLMGAKPVAALHADGRNAVETGGPLPAPHPRPSHEENQP